jgi:hypothetical protein
MTNYERRAATSIMLAAIWVCAATYAILLFLGCGAPPEYLEAAGIGRDKQELIVPQGADNDTDVWELAPNCGSL